MNLLSSFNDFYNDLSSDGLFFFWIIVFLFCFLIFLSIVLILKNKKLIKLLNEENNLDNDGIDFDDTPIVQEEAMIEKVEEQISQVEELNSVEIEEVVKDDASNLNKQEVVEEVKKEKIVEENGPYKKNVLREINARMQTSPISISKEDVIYNNYDISEVEEENYGFDKSYLREESVSPLEMMEDTFEVNDNMKFASEIVERMEEEIKPSNIELTDYEKKQEEEAIISYDELLKVKDKIYNITEDEETDEFIDELKSFRLDL